MRTVFNLCPQPRRVLAALLATLLLLPPNVARACEDLDVVCQLAAIASLDSRTATLESGVTTLGEITIPGVVTTLDNTGKAVSKAASDVTDFTKNAPKVIKQFNSVVTNVRLEAFELTGNLLDRINSARDLTDYYLLRNQARYLAFAGTDGCSSDLCVPFKEGLKGLVDDYERTINKTGRALAALTLDPAGVPVVPLDLTPLRQVIDLSQGVVLYPLYEALSLYTPAGFDSGIHRDEEKPIMTLASMRQLFQPVDTALDQLVAVGQPSRSVTSRAAAEDETNVNGRVCQMLVASGYADRYVAGATVVSLVAGELGKSAAELRYAGLVFDVGLKLGVDMAASVEETKKISLLRSVGKKLDALSKLLGAVGSGVFDAVGHCRVRLNQQTMLCFLSEKNPHKGVTLTNCLRRVEKGYERFGF